MVQLDNTQVNISGPHVPRIFINGRKKTAYIIQLRSGRFCWTSLTDSIIDIYNQLHCKSWLGTWNIILQAIFANSCLCAEIGCGPPLFLPHTKLVWDGSSRLGSAALYECMDGFYQESGTNISTCLQSGEWREVSLKCQGTVIISAHLWYSALSLFSAGGE